MREDEIFLAVTVCAILVVILLCFCCAALFGENTTSTRVESASDPLNLHGYGVDAALKRLPEYLDIKKRAGRNSATVITGRGDHSPYQRPVLKPAVQNWLDKNGYSYDSNVGDFKVYL